MVEVHAAVGSDPLLRRLVEARDETARRDELERLLVDHARPLAAAGAPAAPDVDGQQVRWTPGMSLHLNSHDEFLRGTLSGEDAEAVVRHLAECPQCAEAARSSEAAVRATNALAAWLLADEHPSSEAITAYVDGAADDAVADHVERCPRCREDAADLRAMAKLVHRPRIAPWLAFAAAVLIALIATLLAVRKPALSPVPDDVVTSTEPAPPPVRPREYRRPAWRAAVDQAVREGTLKMPATLAALLRQADVLRSTVDAPSAPMKPTGAIVETTRPRFNWPAVSGGTYIVSILDGENMVMQSGELREAAWRPPRELARGRTYQWEVDIRTGEKTRTIPEPPAPPALFRVLDQAAHEELDEARARHGDDPLLLGVLYARHGLRGEAERELARVQTEQGRRLLRSIKTWGAP